MHRLLFLSNDLDSSYKGSGIAQLRYQKREKRISFPKISITSFDVSKGVGGGGESREVHTIDVSCGQNRYAGLP